MSTPASKNIASSTKESQEVLLATKLYIPQTRTNFVPRPNLIERLNEGLQNKLMLISAPAGFGKTTILSEWIQQSNIPVAWVSLDERDGDPVRFLTYFVTALQKIESNIGKTALAILQSPQSPPIESILTNLTNKISAIPNDFALILDDYHLINSKQIHDIIEYLLEKLPPKMHLVIATRSDPPFTMARLRSQNQLSEFRTTDLSFTINETTEFLNNIMTLGLSIDDIAMLDSRTEGWIAGLQLAALSMQGGKNISSFIKSFAGDDRHIMDYLVEEVLNLQPEPIRKFLLQTSILSRFTGSLCDIVTARENGKQILDYLEKTNLFLVSLDNKRHWYRYHHLFTDLLQQQLRQTKSDLEPELHRRASKWYEQNKLVDEAIDHALAAQDYETAAIMIEELAEVIWERGEQGKFLNWLNMLPKDQLSIRPQISIFHAWVLQANGEVKEAEMSLQMVEKAIQSIPDEVSKDDLDQIVNFNTVQLKSRILVMHAMIAFRRGEIPSIIKFSHKALKSLSENDLAWRSIAAILLGHAHKSKGDLAAAYQAQLKALEASKASDNIFLLLTANANLLVSLRQQGKLQQTLEICQQQVQLANENEMSQSIVVGWLLTIWGEVLAELNDLNGAIDKAKKGIKLTEQCGDKIVDMFCESYLCLIRILYSAGNMSEAEEIIHKLENIARKSDVNTKFTSMIEAWQARIWVAQNKMEAASQWVQTRIQGVDGEFPFLREDEYVVLTRIMIVQEKLAEAIVLLQYLLKKAEAGGRISKVIEILILQALASHAAGETSRAMSVLARALTRAEPGGFIRIFVDEGPLMAEMLEKVLDENDNIPRAYVKKLLSAFRLSKIIRTDDNPINQLSERELEVLRLMAAGLSNSRIAKELFISLNTVKTHTKNINSKLNVHNRTEAVKKGKDLDLL